MERVRSKRLFIKQNNTDFSAILAMLVALHCGNQSTFCGKKYVLTRKVLFLNMNENKVEAKVILVTLSETL